MLINTIIKESSGANLKADVIKENDEYVVKYYINDVLSGITKHSKDTAINESVEKWFQSVKPLNG